MFVIVKINENLSIGTVVQYDSASDVWKPAVNLASPVGIVTGETIETEGIFHAKVTFAGCCFALSSRDIPNNGGWLNVENGKVFVDNSITEHCGLISPVASGSDNRLADSLVMIHIR